MQHKISGGTSEQGIVVGNVFDKYGSSNPLVKRIMRGFETALDDLVREASPSNIHEVGCGEGHWVIKWHKQGIAAVGTDFSSQVIGLARENFNSSEDSGEIFKTASIYDLNRDEHSADLIVCCEVLEHLEHPEEAMKVLREVAAKNLILSVPREPLWRVLNLARGKYMRDLGNTPGHIQHWSKQGFINFVSNYFIIQTVVSPLPWTMLLCKA